MDSKKISAVAVAVILVIILSLYLQAGACGSVNVGKYFPFLFFAVIPLIIGLAGYMTYKRKKDLEQLALSNGLSFDPDAALLPYLENSGMDIFNRGRARKARNLIIASAPGAAKAYFFDYSYVTGSGKNSSTHSFTLAFFEFSQSVFPRFELRPENFLDKVGEMLGYQDIDVDGFPEFSKKYRLTGPDRAAVLAFFGSQTVSFLEMNLGWSIQASGQNLIAFKRAATVPVAEYRTFMEEAKNLIAAIARK